MLAFRRRVSDNECQAMVAALEPEAHTGNPLGVPRVQPRPASEIGGLAEARGALDADIGR